MRSHARYASYVARHKWFVLLAGIKVRAPLWRLVIHDWSKLTPAEWGPYVDAFYGDLDGWLTEHDAETVRRSRAARFDAAWLHHQHRNPHHWQHWLLQEDDGLLKTLRMPSSLVREMVADWMGAGRAITGSWGVGKWYAANAHKIKLHPLTRREVEALIAKVDRP